MHRAEKEKEREKWKVKDREEKAGENEQFCVSRATANERVGNQKWEANGEKKKEEMKYWHHWYARENKCTAPRRICATIK